MKRLAILLSGRGSNFLALDEAVRSGHLPAEIVVVISNRADAPGLERAGELGYETVVLSHRDFSRREEHDEAIAKEIESRGADLILLAGYMRILSGTFIERFRNRILNIHPSLLPAFPGSDAQRQAWDYGVKVAGCTVHFVDEGVDTGPIVAQRTVEVKETDGPEDLAARILEQEHQAYVGAVRRLCTESWAIEGRRVQFSS
jgi:phosphoribosylglycinamide formyltransferase 1